MSYWSQAGRSAAQILESHPKVICYVRNYKLDFTIPHRFAEANHQYVPDFILVLAKDPADSTSPRLNASPAAAHVWRGRSLILSF
jgi:hypothetical protein